MNMEKDRKGKEKNTEKNNIEDLTLPHIKKVVHTIMTKFYGHDGYRHSDLVRKILRKLKCDYSVKAASRVRNQLRNWIISNNDILKYGKVDSKKGILLEIQEKKKINLPSSTDASEVENPKNMEVEIPVVAEKQSDDQNDKSNEASNSENQSDNHNEKSDQADKPNSKEQISRNNEILDFDQERTILKNQTACNCSCQCKNKNNAEIIIKHEVIDLTIDDDDSIKIEDDEDDMYDINAVINQLDDNCVQPPLIYLIQLQ